MTNVDDWLEEQRKRFSQMIEAFAEGGIRLFEDRRDVTEEWVARLREILAGLDALAARRATAAQVGGTDAED